MKKTFTFLAALFIVVSGFAQSPEKMSYQAVIRDNSGDLVTNSGVGMQISIVQGSETGTAVYIETASPSTNVNGLVTYEIGTGTVVSGSFSAIDWSAGPYFIKTETDPAGGSSYSISGTSQLLSVPFALHAKTVEIDNVDDADANATNELQTMSISGTVLTLSDGGGSVTLPSSGGGGDNWGTQKVESNTTLSGEGTSANPLAVNGDLTDDQTLSVSGDQLTISEGNTVTLPAGGGEADNWGTQIVESNTTLTGEGTSANPLAVNGDLTDDQTLSVSGDQLTISEGNTVTLPASGGGATEIDDLSDAKSNGSSVFIGKKAGKSYTGSAGSNVTLGDNTLYFNTSGTNNTILGAGAGEQNKGSGNVFLGYRAGSNTSNESNKLFIENSADNIPLIGGDFSTNEVVINGELEVTETIKIAGGSPAAGKVLTSDASGNASWVNAVKSSKSTSSSVYIGQNAGAVSNSGAADNVIVGTDAGKGLTTGTNNIFIGHEAGKNTTTGSGNVIIGADNNYYNEDNYFAINNRTGGTPLIYGDFGNFNGAMGKVNIWGTLSAVDLLMFSGVQRRENSDKDMLAYIYGWINSDGTIMSESSSNGFSASKTATGKYNITFTDDAMFTPDSYKEYIVVVSRGSAGFVWADRHNSSFDVSTTDASGTLANRGFSFVVYKPKYH